jgi:phosphoglucomutase
MELMAKKGKSLLQLVRELDDEFGTHRYRRRDVVVTENQKNQIMNACAKQPRKLGKYPIIKTITKDGYKFFTEDGAWLLIRTSGTEPLIRFYSEASSMSKVNELLDAGLKLR